MKLSDIKKKANEIWKEEIGNKSVIFVGTATCGLAAGAKGVIKAIEEELKNKSIDAKIIEVGCIGLCFAEPLVDVAKNGNPRISYNNVDEKKARKIIEEYFINNNPSSNLALGVFSESEFQGIPSIWSLPVLKRQERIVLRRCGFIDPENIYHYIAHDGYSGLEKVLSLTQDEVIEEVKKSGIRGRGGAGFPTGVKWEFCRKEKSDEKYIICNADEGDPGAFMDRSLLESDPHSVLEGMLIAGYAIGASYGYVYVRSEYPLAVKRLKIAIEQMKKGNLIGDNILGSNFSFHIKIKEGAGAFVCGEETALIASVEGKRGMPKARPPFPAKSGLYGKPTVINNVETFANISCIFQKGAEWFASFGTEKSKGTKTFALAGKIANTGLIEVPMGIKLKDIVYEIGGGIPGNKKFKAVQTGGPSGGCIPEELIDTGADYESLSQIGSIMGSGGMIVMDEDTCVVDIAKYFLSFTQKESCGKCIPCRIGTKQMLDILQKLCKGEGKKEDVDLLEITAETVKSGSLCGLGQTAPNPVLTTLKYFHDEYIAHIEGKCPALVCKDLIRYSINEEKCTGCGACKKGCPVDAIEGERKKPHKVILDKCIKCGICYDTCPTKVSAVYKLTGKD